MTLSDTHSQLVTMGGGFSMEPKNLRLDRFVLSLSPVPDPRVLFVPTAGGDSDNYLRRFYSAFTRLPCRPTHLSLFEIPPEGIAERVGSVDVIYVGGGSTFNLLTLWRAWGVDDLFAEAWQRGVVMAGVSAGAICWFEQGLTDSLDPGVYRPLEGLGWLGGSFCPHLDGEPQRLPTLKVLLAAGELAPGYACDDGAALHFVGTELKEAVASRPEASAYRTEPSGLTPLPTRYLEERG